MYVVIDTITNDAIGPFETDHDATIFTMEAADLLGDADTSQFDIYQFIEPQEWALNNLEDEYMDKVLAASNTSITPKITPISYERKENDVNNDTETAEINSAVLN
jgi:hypothetical protein